MPSRLRKASPAVVFVVLMGIVSLFADMTHEGARSIYGAYLPLLGASATALGFATGFGECIGYALRLATGIIADKTKHYWGMTMLGYGVNIVAIPFLALVPENGWFWACLLIILERTGKAVRQPAKNTLLSFAATRVGVGKAFAVQADYNGTPVTLFANNVMNKGHVQVAYRLIANAVYSSVAGLSDANFSIK